MAHAQRPIPYRQAWTSLRTSAASTFAPNFMAQLRRRVLPPLITRNSCRTRHPGDAESSRKLQAANLHVQFERRTEANAQARLLRPDRDSSVELRARRAYNTSQLVTRTSKLDLVAGALCTAA